MDAAQHDLAALFGATHPIDGIVDELDGTDEDVWPHPALAPDALRDVLDELIRELDEVEK